MTKSALDFVSAFDGSPLNRENEPIKFSINDDGAPGSPNATDTKRLPTFGAHVNNNESKEALL